LTPRIRSRLSLTLRTRSRLRSIPGTRRINQISLIPRTRSGLSRLRIVLGGRINRLRIVLGGRINRLRIVPRRGVSFYGLITILFRGRLFLTNSSSKFSPVVLSVKQTVSYIAMMKKLIKRTTNVNVNIGLILLGNVKYLSNLDSTLGFESLRSGSKEKILAYTRSQD
jgi:hypothetical protein